MLYFTMSCILATDSTPELSTLLSNFDTNVSNHHHFYDSESSELIDIDASEIVIQKLPKAPNGKKIKNVEVFINLKN